ncbi:hypothetical protein NUW58_g6129 [Xylaria curta]|uniref:Uncharacterized protein n=1 Tax=Xylaria curta TaxID=42375 RepID=A0ACC1NYF3_9PEZI|nr:hypothetical protein NUW58_g6129 [Xylaria curta]
MYCLVAPARYVWPASSTECGDPAVPKAQAGSLMPGVSNATIPSDRLLMQLQALFGKASNSVLSEPGFSAQGRVRVWFSREIRQRGTFGATARRAPYEEVIERLTAVRGLGLWSAEMFACFGLKRIDVFSLGDLGVQRGMAAFVGRDVAKLKSKGGKFKYMSEADMTALSDQFKPYRSLFMWYMWRVEETDLIMRPHSGVLALSLSSAIPAVQAASLAEICTVDYIRGALPIEDLGLAVTLDTSSVSVALTTNRTAASNWYPTTVVDYCTVTFAYSHHGLNNDTVRVSYLVPSPDKFTKRYLSTGGGGLAINSGTQYTPSGIIVGAVAGITDGGFGSFNTQFDKAFLIANGTVNWQATYMFGYQARVTALLAGRE